MYRYVRDSFGGRDSQKIKRYVFLRMCNNFEHFIYGDIFSAAIPDSFQNFSKFTLHIAQKQEQWFTADTQ